MADDKAQRFAEARPTNPAAVDVGGTLAKIVYWRPANPPALPAYITKETAASFSQERIHNFQLSPQRSLQVSGPNGILRFLKFPTTQTEPFISFAKETKLPERYGMGQVKYLHVTGGGAFKYAARAEELLGLKVVQHDEMQCLVRGLNFLLRHAEGEMFSLRFNPDPTVKSERIPVPTHGQPPYPYILVNVGSGVSVLLITGDEEYVRVTGSGIGGGTFWGLARLLTGFKTFDEVINACRPGAGDNTKVDVLVRDIYGVAPNPLGLNPDVPASYFGKVSRVGDSAPKYEDADMAKSLLYMVSDNVAQVGNLVARIRGSKTVVFCGGFVVDNPCVWQCITNSFEYWSHGSMSACFLTHDGYLGAIGALLSTEVPEPPPATPAATCETVAAASPSSTEQTSDE